VIEILKEQWNFTRFKDSISRYEKKSSEKSLRIKLKELPFEFPALLIFTQK